MRGTPTNPSSSGRVLAIAATGLVASVLAYWLRSRQTEASLTTKTKARLAPKLKQVVPEAKTEA